VDGPRGRGGRFVLWNRTSSVAPRKNGQSVRGLRAVRAGRTFRDLHSDGPQTPSNKNLALPLIETTRNHKLNNTRQTPNE
jgi:hypothetical protein